jgi:hypothetical protein
MADAQIFFIVEHLSQDPELMKKYVYIYIYMKYIQIY